MFSCGTGITPFYSMIMNLNNKTKYNIYLYSSFKSPNQSYLFDNLNNLNLSKYAYFSSVKKIYVAKYALILFTKL